MKLQWASGLLLGAVVNYVDASAASHLPPNFSTDSSDVVVPTYGAIDPEKYCWQAKPRGGSRLDRTNFAVECSSQENDDNQCKNVLDGQVHTYWRSESSNKTQNNWIIIDLGSEQKVNGLSMLPLMDKDARGQVAKHEVYLSNDKRDWKRVAYGLWGWNKSLKLAVFEPEVAKYVKLIAKGEAPLGKSPDTKYPETWTSIVDIAIYAVDFIIPRDPSRGTWGPTLDLPIVPVAGAHTAVNRVNNGDIILWSAWADNQFFASPGGETFTTTWDPIKEDIFQASVANNEHDMFCPGISMDFDGRIVVSGGADSDKTSIFNGTGWERGESMALHRGYHSTTTLSDGRIFAIGGSWSGGPNNPKDGELYDPWTRTWKRLYNLQREIIETDDRPLRADNHAWLFGWKNGSVFHAGPSNKMHWFNTRTKGGSYVPAGYRLDDQHSMSGNNVMFDAVQGKILTFGGQERYDGSFGTRNAHIITISEPYKKPKVQVAGLNGSKSENNPGGMFYQRVFHTSVVLPDGSVFIAGGEIWGQPFNEAERDIQLTPEIYYPDRDIFAPLQRNNVVRVYHSLSILLPDATVLNGGGGLCGNCTVNHYDAQIFRPPYLYNKDGTPATQPKTPSVKNRSGKVTVGKTLRFFADADIKSASLVRLGTVSHTVNTDQRRVPLDKYKCEDPEDGYKYCEAQIYPDPGVVLPGYYMLFVMNSAGVPSKAATVKVELDFPLGHFTEEDYLIDEKDEEVEHKKDCDMDVAGGKQVQGMVAMIFAAARKFWNPPQSTLVTQG
ncbi:galactose oxidase precursor [Penicillium samsonianum]|uniref:galactose oxidase precursor n=1 Tax=Penicillium samsonianum TaxID=1882272 RepID=UPI0025469DC8|nr:galactose oxidase precursor [Penicillium samsonianum]KAJ6127781.1 galactose oxidase precursor [Penicillium samsonianum]